MEHKQESRQSKALWEYNYEQLGNTSSGKWKYCENEMHNTV
jgi:hypothetical protein